MFTGTAYHTLDEKGRVVLPAKYREELEGGCYVTPGQDRCLYVFTVERFQEEADRVKRLPRTDGRARGFGRTFFHRAEQQALDRQGRLVIDQSLREWAELTREVVVAGSYDRIEVWNSERYGIYRDQHDSDYSDIEEALSEYGI
ncbi:MAG: division/cell wall cluster transcriptional repressor MraZ [Acidimicrobiia bacterium]